MWKFSSPLLFILFDKICSSMVTSLPEILSLCIFFMDINPNKGYWIIKHFSQHRQILFMGKEILLQCGKPGNNSGYCRLKWEPPGFYTSKNMFVFNINKVTKVLQFLHPYCMYIYMWKYWNILFAMASMSIVECQRLSEVHYAKYRQHILYPECLFLNCWSLSWHKHGLFLSLQHLQNLYYTCPHKRQ